MNWKKIGKAVLFPHAVWLGLLLPIATAFLIYALVSLPDTNPLRIASYLLAFYTLVIFSARVPRLVQWIRTQKKSNRWLLRWKNDHRLRMNLTLTAHVLWNGAYAVLQLVLGVSNRSIWYASLAVYYGSLAVMRAFLVQLTLHHKPGEKLHEELVRYRICGWIFLVMNLALSGVMLEMIRDNRAMPRQEIVTIAMAAYTFTTLTVAIVNLIRYRKYNSPAMSASKAISLASACVSMLTLENNMLTTFQRGELSPNAQMLFLALSGGAVSVVIVVMAVTMIVQSSKRMNAMESDYGAERDLSDDLLGAATGGDSCDTKEISSAGGEK